VAVPERPTVAVRAPLVAESAALQRGRDAALDRTTPIGQESAASRKPPTKSTPRLAVSVTVGRGDIAPVLQGSSLSLRLEPTGDVLDEISFGPVAKIQLWDAESTNLAGLNF